MSFDHQVSNLQSFGNKIPVGSSVHVLSVKVKKMWRKRKEKPSVEELEGGVYLCVVHDIFFTLRLLSCQHDG